MTHASETLIRAACSARITSSCQIVRTLFHLPLFSSKFVIRELSLSCELLRSRLDFRLYERDASSLPATYVCDEWVRDFTPVEFEILEVVALAGLFCVSTSQASRPTMLSLTNFREHGISGHFFTGELNRNLSSTVQDSQAQAPNCGVPRGPLTDSG